MQEGASGSSGMQSETWQAGENSREEESWVRAEGGGGGDREGYGRGSTGSLTAQETEEENEGKREARRENVEFMTQ